MITDLRIGNCIVIQKNSGYHAGVIQTLGDTKCSVKDQSDKTTSFPYDNFRPAKITKRWLHDNEFDDIDEGSPEGQPAEEPGSSSRFVHRSLPISYSHGDHRLFVYGHIFPVKVLYVHHMQNALIDCGISFEPVFRDSHCNQVDGYPIVQLLGGMKKSPEFFDTNAAFGFSGMPKLKVASSGKAISNRKPASPYLLDFQNSFVSIMGLQNEGDRNLARYFYENVGLDGTGNFTSVSLVRVGQNSYVFTTEGSPKNSIPMPWESISRFIEDYPGIVRDRRYRLAIHAVTEARDRLLEEYPEVLLNNEIASEFAAHPGPVSFIYTRRGRVSGVNVVAIKGKRTGTLYERIPAAHLEDLMVNVGGIVTFEEYEERDFERFESGAEFGQGQAIGYGFLNEAKLSSAARYAKASINEDMHMAFAVEGPADGNLVDDGDLHFGDEVEREAQIPQPQRMEEEALNEVAEPRQVERGPEPEIYSTTLGKKKSKNKKSSRGI